ncbi:hypothetical protein HNY73_016570 [Argiope bruennichi]|uniref:Uncharacterized protein n=1 Tax=Argiope bruennichi TaxID=94029 RepID=A0A8T0EN60_ARGBR|nr:hypothetical protein HNY73_016570 [Argiope bruennichi]
MNTTKEKHSKPCRQLKDWKERINSVIAKLLTSLDAKWDCSPSEKAELLKHQRSKQIIETNKEKHSKPLRQLKDWKAEIKLS